MFCMKCQNDLSECTCTDPHERLKRIQESSHVHITPESKKLLDAQAKRNKEEKTLEE